VSIDYVLEKIESLQRQIDAHCNDHPLEHHDHLMDHDEHLAHHAEIDKPKEKREGERRSAERRTNTEKYEGEERRGS
jgi:hypothetical protein